MRKSFLLILAPFVLSGCWYAAGVGDIVKFEEPDIKDEFCGVHINFQYCKCAFHNDFCDAIGMNRREANAHVQAEYSKWVEGLREKADQACAASGGIPDHGDCTRCKEGYVVVGDACVEADEADEARADLAGDVERTFVPDGPLTSECAVVPETFDADWRKYSDIDDRIPPEERSFESKGALTAYDEMIALMIEGFALERDHEIEEQALAEMRAYKDALVRNIKTNLLKSFWRLAWVTYATIDSSKGLGDSYKTLLTEDLAASSLGAGLKLVQGMMPSDSALAIDTSSAKGKALSVGANTALEAIDSLGDPTKIATELFKSAANAPLPSADITPEEIAILKDQHLTNGALDMLIAEAEGNNAERAVRMAEIEDAIAGLQAEIAEWEGKEKERVRIGLEESCKEQKRQFEGVQSE